MSGMKDLFGDTPFEEARSPAIAKAARDEAMKRVEQNAGEDWSARALRMIGQLPFGEYTGEGLRITLRERGLPPPHHHNAWGALINSAIRKRLLFDTGRRAHMRTEKSHARKTPIYRR